MAKILLPHMYLLNQNASMLEKIIVKSQVLESMTLILCVFVLEAFKNSLEPPISEKENSFELIQVRGS